MAERRDTGGRLWRLRYRMGGREKLISLGAYPDVPLKRAREKRDEARRLIADDIDPSAERQAKRAALLETFEGVAKEWLELQSKSLAPETISILGTRLKSARDSVVHFGYELVRLSDGTLLAEGETTHIVTDPQMKIAVLPDKYLNAFRAALRE